MFGTPSVSHEWDALAFGLSTLPAIVAMLLVAAAYWEQWHLILSEALQARSRRTSAKALSLSKRTKVSSLREPSLKKVEALRHADAGSSAIVG